MLYPFIANPVMPSFHSTPSELLGARFFLWPGSRCFPRLESSNHPMIGVPKLNHLYINKVLVISLPKGFDSLNIHGWLMSENMLDMSQSYGSRPHWLTSIHRSQFVKLCTWMYLKMTYTIFPSKMTNKMYKIRFLNHQNLGLPFFSD